MTTDIEVLIKQIRQGSEPALLEFIEAHRAPLLAFINKNMSDGLKGKVEAADILQEVSLNAVESLSQMDFEQKTPFNWLCHLAERRIIDNHRKYFQVQKRAAGREVSQSPAGNGEKQGFLDLLVASITSPSQAFSRGAKEMKLLVALETLPEDHREAIRLKYVEGLPTKEIAALLDKSDVAVRVMISRSMAKLQEMLKNEDEFKSMVGR
ncbi:sigma-70 family RNA polymerase sigma factor [uncultured Gimesia sp.]|jgi:RNA polymerase sigma-70 factor, ECF subfamily|uniref:RNA polymerase sigma factor n=1 Tax=uncultured Gimesia sp. TaxID=1678688 RepID=UPI00262D79AA|nr:sigma-70 family RNA polymerase sigma factor [uncultured Gimesia sp.]